MVTARLVVLITTRPRLMEKGVSLCTVLWRNLPNESSRDLNTLRYGGDHCVLKKNRKIVEELFIL